MISVSKSCLYCRRPVKGRADKKFCDDTCRNNYNNHLNSDTSPLMRNINNTLRRNRRILEELLPPGKKGVRINKEKLLEMGFQFQYITHTFTTGAGKTYHYCYDYGYLPLEDQSHAYLIVREIKDAIVSSS